MAGAVAESLVGTRASLTHLALARQVARRTAASLLAERPSARAVRQDSRRDVKIAADTTAHRLICDALRAESPLPILSEEDEATHGQSGNGDRWIVDPLDGSLNFARGIPWSCISIALWRGMTPVLGVIHDLNRDEQFSGLVGTGAWVNETTSIHVSEARTPQEAILCTGFPAGREYATPAVQAFVTQIQVYKKIRLLGSAALSLAYVACGRADAYQEEQIALWDVAAGVAIVQAAGGVAHCRRIGTKQAVTVRAGNRYLTGEAE